MTYATLGRELMELAGKEDPLKVSKKASSNTRLSKSERVAREKAAIGESLDPHPNLNLNLNPNPNLDPNPIGEAIEVQEVQQRRGSVELEHGDKGDRATSVGRITKEDRAAREKAAMALARGEDPKQHLLEKHLKEAKLQAANAVREEMEAIEAMEATEASMEAVEVMEAVEEVVESGSGPSGRHSDAGATPSKRRERRDSKGRGEEARSPEEKKASLKDRMAREYAAMALARGEDPANIQSQFEAIEQERATMRVRDEKNKKEMAKKKAQQKKKEARIAQEKIAMGIIEQPPASPAGDLKPARKIIDTSKLTKAERMALEQAAMSGVGSNFSMGDEGAGTGTGGTT